MSLDDEGKRLLRRLRILQIVGIAFVLVCLLIALKMAGVIGGL